METDYKKLKQEISRINGGMERYKKEVSTNKRCDKHGLGFNEDSRFSGFKVQLSLDSWLGYYGDSSCGNAISCGDKFKQHFIQYLNSNVNLIIKSVVERMEDELRNYLDDEIEKTEQYLKSLKEV